ncbi:hypothetical protein B0H10DRAFT_1961477 [Mycena sp. CBHHK59/15]|nr:hypothetical protein B0H10DRAFT_1961477 [Mycena sp. CBHHK59/15]
MRQQVPANAEPLITHVYQSEDASLIGGCLEHNWPIDYFGSPLMPSPILAPTPDTTAKKINRSHRQRAAKRACEDPEVHMTARLSAAANHPDAANRIPRVVRVETNAVNLNYTKPGFVGNSQAASSGQVGELKDSIVIVDEQDCIVAALQDIPLALIGTSPSAKCVTVFGKFVKRQPTVSRMKIFTIVVHPGTLKQSHKAKEEAVKMLSSEPWALRFSAFQSPTVTHSNTPLQEGEEHFSFTQYAAGGLFRWVEYGHMKEGDFKLSDREAWLAATSPAACKARVSAGLARFSKYDELPDNLTTVFPVKDTSSKSL